MCPMCLATLDKVSDGELEMDDISSFLVKAFCDTADDEQSEP